MLFSYCINNALKKVSHVTWLLTFHELSSVWALKLMLMCPLFCVSKLNFFWWFYALCIKISVHYCSLLYSKRPPSDGWAKFFIPTLTEKKISLLLRSQAKRSQVTTAKKFNLYKPLSAQCSDRNHRTVHLQRFEQTTMWKSMG